MVGPLRGPSASETGQAFAAGLCNRYARARGRYGSRCLIALFTSVLRVRLPDYLPDFRGVKGEEDQWEKERGSMGKGERASGKGGKSQWEKKKGPVGKRCLTPDRVRASAEPNILSE